MLRMVYADNQGLVYDDPHFLALGRSGELILEVSEEDFIPLPSGATLTVLPDRLPLGWNQRSQQFEVAADAGLAVAALLPQGYTRTLLPAFVKTRGAGHLPLFGYTAVAWHPEEERFYAAAVQTDGDTYKWDPCNYNTADLEQLVEIQLKRFSDNRIVRQLATCALEYGCFTAQNFFYQRWEAGVPVSPICNARCVGCISQQESECCPSPQSRIDYTPSVSEVSEVMAAHLEAAGETGIISFGQGCEGEPLLQAGLIGRAIQEVRAVCQQGTINANTNAGYTAGVRQVCQAGIDSLRVSIISARPEHYAAYYRPHNYSLQDVKESLKLAADMGVYTSLNLLTTPGVTDTESELQALIDLVRETKVKMIQFRNLNLDPDIYREIWAPAVEQQPMGIVTMIGVLRQELPEVELGSFSKPV